MPAVCPVCGGNSEDTDAHRRSKHVYGVQITGSAKSLTDNDLVTFVNGKTYRVKHAIAEKDSMDPSSGKPIKAGTETLMFEEVNP